MTVRWTRRLAGVAALVLGLTGCGGTDGPGTWDGGAAAAETRAYPA
ncbi:MULTISPECIES: hypothetical protein [Micromonospora]|nr:MULTISPECIES: hypothetical protein [Micromonospora]